MTREGERTLTTSDLRDDPCLRERVLRFGADMICLWRLCAEKACVRAKACRGDPRVCAGRMADWLDAIDTARFARPSFAEIERALQTPEDLRTYRAWRDALEQVLRR